MLGPIIGDIVGSRFEFSNTSDKTFTFFHRDCHVTDDSVMTVAVMATMLEANLQDETDYKDKLIKNFKKFYRMFPDGDYGLGFVEWLESDDPQPYNSYGNGACMRVAPVAAARFGTRECLIKWTTEVSHNHRYALSWAAWLVHTIAKVRILDEDDALDYIKKSYQGIQNYDVESYSPLGFKPTKGEFDETCQGTVPLAIEAVLEAEDFEDAIRNAVSYGGDSDTLACIAGALAEAVFGIPASIRRKALGFIPVQMMSVILQFEKEFQR